MFFRDLQVNKSYYNNLLLYVKSFFGLCINVFDCGCMSIQIFRYPTSPDVGIRCPGADVIGGCDLPCIGFEKPSADILKGQYVLLIADPYLCSYFASLIEYIT